MLNPQASLQDLQAQDEFIQRHIGPDQQQQSAMLALLGVNSLDELIDQSVPDKIRRAQPMDLPGPVTEAGALQKIKTLADQNLLMTNVIGMGYHGTLTPT